MRFNPRFSAYRVSKVIIPSFTQKRTLTTEQRSTSPESGDLIGAALPEVLLSDAFLLPKRMLELLKVGAVNCS